MKISKPIKIHKKVTGKFLERNDNAGMCFEIRRSNIAINVAINAAIT